MQHTLCLRVIKPLSIQEDSLLTEWRAKKEKGGILPPICDFLTMACNFSPQAEIEMANGHKKRRYYDGCLYRFIQEEEKLGPQIQDDERDYILTVGI